MSNAIHAATAAAVTHNMPISKPEEKDSKNIEPFKLGPAVTLSLSNTKESNAAPAKVDDATEGDPDGDGH